MTADEARLTINLSHRSGRQGGSWGRLLLKRTMKGKFVEVELSRFVSKSCVLLSGA